MSIAAPVVLLALAAALLILGGLTGEPAVAQADGQPQPLRYELNTRWAPSARILSGVERIHFENAGSGQLGEIWLRLWPNDSIPGQAVGCREPGTRITGISGARARRYAVSCSALALALPRALSPGETTTVSFRFKVSVPTQDDVFGRSSGVDLIGNAIPVMAVRDAAGWHLERESATGDAAFTLAAAWHATLRLPAGLRAAGTGAEVSDTVRRGTRTRVVVTDTPHARDFALALGRLARRQTTVDGVRVRVFFGSGMRPAAASRSLRSAGEALRTFESWFGPYGSPELDLVLVRLPFYGQEYPEVIFTEPDRATIAHEVAHQWFYGIVGDDQFREPWLDESFASWSELQLAPGSYACNPGDPLAGHRGGLALGMSYYEQRPNQYTSVIYGGGACALTVLAQELGENRFLGLLRDEVARYRYGVIHTADFLALLARVDPAVAQRWEALVGLSP